MITSNIPLVLIHGWGADSHIWQPLRHILSQYFEVISIDLPGFGSTRIEDYSRDNILCILREQLPPHCILVGWSLGGMLATAYADQYPERVSQLITLGTNVRFVADGDGWPAMAKKTYIDFCDFFERNPVQCLRQFNGLEAKGDSSERQLLKTLRRLPVPEMSDDIRACWRSALKMLGELDNRLVLARIPLASLHLYGAEDALVPVEMVDELSSLNSNIQTHIFEGVAHVPHLSVPDKVASKIVDFIAANVNDAGAIDPYVLDKQEIAASFSRAADSYDKVAHLQREVGETLLQLLPDDFQPKVVADLGSGTGYFTEHLKSRYRDALCLGVDIAEGMSAYASQHQSQSIRWVCADVENMPLADNCLDLLYSNFAFQWCQNLSALKKELFRLLRPGGILVLSLTGPRSLMELRRAWQGVDEFTHVNRFAPVEDLQQALLSAGFTILSTESKDKVKYYAQLKTLTQELKGLGAHNLNRGRNKAMTGRKQIEALKHAYERLRTPQGLPVTWEIVTVMAQKP